MCGEKPHGNLLKLLEVCEKFWELMKLFENHIH